jgi:pimeloyl-ACP methyl ester carboxylesterase
MWIGLGYAIVATDYAGLGSEARSSVIDMTSNANDVINAVKAAHAAVPHLGARWIALGDSEGAPAVVALGEMQRDQSDTNYLGSIALSGVADAKDVYERLAKGSERGRIALLAHTVKTGNPQFEVKDVLTSQGLSFYDQAGQTCAPPANSADELLKPGWENNQFVREFFNRNRVGEKKSAVPLLVISGEADAIFPFDLVSSAVARLCKQGNRVQFDHYSKLDRNRVRGESVTEQTSWVSDRFAGKPAPENCP